MTPFNRRLLTLALLYICVEGLVINITFPSKIGFILKDAMLILAYLSLLGSNRGQSFGSLGRLAAPLAVFALIQTLYLLVPAGLPFLARSTGWKMRLLYIPVMFLAYRYVRTFDDVKRLAYILLAAAVPVSLFGIYLYFAGPGVLRSMGGTYSAMVYSTTGVWRVPGTFTSPGQYGHYLTFNGLLAVGLLLSGDLSMRRRVLLWGSLGLMVLAMLASGSRAPLVLAAACAGLTIVSLRQVSRLVSMSVIVYALFAVGFATLGAGVADRVDSIASTEHIDRFQRTYFGQLFLPKLLEDPMGIGLGAATIGARHFTEFGQVILMESYFGIVAVETGILGLGSVLWLSAAVLLVVWRWRAIMLTAGTSAPLWHVLALFAAVMVLLLPVGPVLDSPPANVYFWLSLGMTARLYDLERWRRAGGVSQAADPPVYTYQPPPPFVPKPTS
ncbi:MAG TPA: hypothetical protein VMN81_10180 [Vicinamibacterales bacterium]|nr:hypothetical protein [Vicinamibacterales bacterium]